MARKLINPKAEVYDPATRRPRRSRPPAPPKVGLSVTAKLKAGQQMCSSCKADVASHLFARPGQKQDASLCFRCVESEIAALEGRPYLEPIPI